MASPELLFLLVILSSLHVSSTVPSPILDSKSRSKEAAISAAATIGQFIESALPAIELIPIYGTGISAAVKIVLFITTGTLPKDDILKKLISEFENLNSKLDQYHVEQRWDSWASGAFHKPEMDIEVAWSSFQTFLKSIKETTDSAMITRHKEDFLAFYQKYEPAPRILNKLLTAKDTTFINNLGQMLAQYVNCHEKDIRQYSVFIHTLIYKGNLLNQVYYRLKNINSQARIDEAAETAYSSSLAMFQVYKFCINYSKEYIEKDVENLIDEKKNRPEMAKNIREFLDSKYELYDWMVVAYKTEDSDHLMESFDKHTLTGFTVVRKGSVSVCLTRQAKGEHKKKGEVEKAIKKCFSEMATCRTVADILSKCKETVDNIRVSQTYTAVHAYFGYSEESHTEDDYTKTEHYIYTGECEGNSFQAFTNYGKADGIFQVMIKSDRAIVNEPCSKMNCGDKRGECVEVGNPSIAMCECNRPYYGKNCEKSLEDYGNDLKKEGLLNLDSILV